MATHSYPTTYDPPGKPFSRSGAWVASLLYDLRGCIGFASERARFMNHQSEPEIRIAAHISRALDERSPIVALETTVIAHGLPRPLNLETALACEEAVRRHGATPATIGIIDGVPTGGLSDDEISHFATGQASDGRRLGCP